jgi:hypothetical protein
MKKRLLKFFFSLSTIFFLYNSAIAAEVSQGICISHDKEGKLITIEEYDTNFSQDSPYGRPTGKKSTFNVSKAKIGIPPKPGDILRISYNVKGTELIAIKVMNITQQDLMKK